MLALEVRRCRFLSASLSLFGELRHARPWDECCAHPRITAPSGGWRAVLPIACADLAECSRVHRIWGKEIRVRPGRPCSRSPPKRFKVRVVLIVLHRLLRGVVRARARGGGERELEIVVLRHQLGILRRGGKWPRSALALQAASASSSARAAS